MSNPAATSSQNIPMDLWNPDRSTPDQPDWNTAVFDGGLAHLIRSVADQEGVRVEFRELAGDIAHALNRLAEVSRRRNDHRREPARRRPVQHA